MLHLDKCISINTDALLAKIAWKKPGSAPSAEVSEAKHPGLFLSSALASASQGDMGGIVGASFASNPQVDPIDVLRFVNGKGFIGIEAETLMGSGVTSWARPAPEGRPWVQLWEQPLPPPGPTYVKVRDPRGRKAFPNVQ